MARVSTKKRTDTRRTRAVKKTKVSRTSTKTVVEPETTKAKPQRSRWQRVPKSERPIRPKLPSVIWLTKSTYRLIAKSWKVTAGIALMYGVLNILLVHGLNGGLNVSDIKSQFDHIFTSGPGHILSGLGVFALLLGSSSSGTANQATGVYQTILLLIISLAIIWTYRQSLSDKQPKLRVRDAFYRGMYPLIPVLLVLLVITIQLVPMLLGGMLFSTIINQGIAVNGLEIGFWAAIFAATVFWSLRMVLSSTFALYIVSLPDMTPMRSLRSARQLVQYRRLVVFSKVVFMPILVLLALAVLMLPVILVAAALAQWVFLILSIAILPIAHAYLYTLYRELLNE